MRANWVGEGAMPQRTNSLYNARRAHATSVNLGFEAQLWVAANALRGPWTWRSWEQGAGKGKCGR